MVDAASCVGCSKCCSVFSLLAMVLLFFFSYLIKKRSITMAVTFSKNGWDFDQKASSVFTAALIYLFTLVLSLACYFVFSKRIAMQDQEDKVKLLEKLREREMK